MDREKRLSHRREYDRARQAPETAEQRKVCLRQRKERDRAWETAEQREVCLRQIGKETRNQPASLAKLAPQ